MSDAVGLLKKTDGDLSSSSSSGSSHTGSKQKGNGGKGSSADSQDPAAHRLKLVRPFLRRKVEAGTETVLRIQKFFGVTPDIASRKWKGFAFYYFHIAAGMGTEIAFITLLPFLFWYCPASLARWVCFAWATSMYLGQVLKDYIMLPRPPPPAVVLERSFSGEWGFPSTHVMGGLVIPFAIAEYLVDNNLATPLLAGACVFVWIGSIAMSRLYLGVHSPTDLIGGLIFGVILYVACHPLNQALDARIGHSPRDVQILTPIVTAVLLLLYPTSFKWTSAYGDTATILGTETGIIMGSTLHPVSLVYYGAHFSDLITFTPLVIGKFFIRYGVGCAMLFLTRLIFKTLMTRVFTYLLTSSGSLKGVPTVTRDRERPYGGYVIEIPTKFVTYSMVGFMATFAMPAFFRYIGLDN